MACSAPVCPPVPVGAPSTASTLPMQCGSTKSRRATAARAVKASGVPEVVLSFSPLPLAAPPSAEAASLSWRASACISCHKWVQGSC